MKKSRLWVCDNYERWSLPFQRVTLKARTKCRFCEWKAQKEVSRIADRQGLNFDPFADHPVKTKFWMKVGQPAIRMVTANGSSGTCYICMECARQLQKNLTREIDSES